MSIMRGLVDENHVSKGILRGADCAASSRPSHLDSAINIVHPRVSRAHASSWSHDGTVRHLSEAVPGAGGAPGGRAASAARPRRRVPPGGPPEGNDLSEKEQIHAGTERTSAFRASETTACSVSLLALICTNTAGNRC